MQGFLKVFGHPNPKNPIGYGIDSVFPQLIADAQCLHIVAGRGFACTILIATTSKGAIYFGRLLLGLSNGFLVTFSNIYVSEVAPAYLRGVLVALVSPWVSMGAILGAAIDNATKTRVDKSCYQLPTACLYIVPVLLSVGLFFVPESPRYLLFQRYEAKAKQSLVRVRGELSNQ
ncbi:uncharacterized protein A1O5_00812 [Cladophialophora psammophila CBS 110553]|uniref:Major facilitator superfamily (MFS) profile domain-containing protein n=1 Tax=Cladophialophora psammophila CBS 110553 TaxID=1182543 RepID=W9Y1E5_9EURO|nr:uncharacterized protein A1O5_00812 [Cladophialophora psammophila CBS 110553]EXJ76304.1 hypothetical protein A1O5_00812 [Cladophialophora psammophila CBS 110553]